MLDVNKAHAYNFEMLGITSYKFNVSTLAQSLVDASVYPSMRSAAMPAAQAVRFLYEVAVEIGKSPISELLCWHTGQQLIQGRESRGAGVVAANEDAKALLAAAFATCVERIERRVKSAEQYARDMSATAAACRV